MSTIPTAAHKASDTEVTHVLAFLLYVRLGTTEEETPQGLFYDKAATTWQTNPALRTLWTQAASDLQLQAESSGLRLTAASTRDLRKELDKLQTVPAHKAYEL